MDLRHRLRGKLDRFRRKPQVPLENAKIIPITKPGTNLVSSSQHAAHNTSAISYNQTRDSLQQSTTTRDEAARTQPNQRPLRTTGLEPSSPAHDSTLGVNIDVVFVSSDMWSVAYREAVETLGKDIDVAILKGENVAQLFVQLEEIDKDKTQESAFFRGVRYLHSLQVPLERFKLALDLASPLTSIEPCSASVFGVVKSVTAIAISFAIADLEFAKQIGEMLEQISYIDDCDTLGQKANKLDIHKALVLVYQNLLEFYSAAFEILTMKEAKLVMRMILETDRLPNIVQDFLKHADNLRRLVQKATWEIVEDIKAMLYDHEIARWLGSEKMSQQSKYHVELQDLRADQACEFLLTDAKFISWYRAVDSQQLAILGDMGCGKSVAMAFLVDELRRRSLHQLPQPKICYHYCRDDESGQIIHIFCTLILSLLEQFSGLKKTFFEWYKEATSSGNFEPATDAKKLEEFLQRILQTLDRPLFIVIDGIDECDSSSQNSLIKSLKRLSQNTPSLKLILSSRPQEEILEQLNGIAQIGLGSDTARDRVIVEKTVERRLFNLSKDLRALVIETLSPLAQGSAIWTRMIVELIEVRKIKALSPMQDFLENIPLPKRLSELYGTLISQCTSGESENLKLATTALEFLAIARRPLSILELAWAVALGSARKEVKTMAALARLVDHQRVMSLIHPFVVHVDFNDLKKRQVKLVHQSVKEFIVGTLNWSNPQSLPISTATDHGMLYRRIGNIEAAISGICIRYLLLDDLGHTDLFSEEQVAIEELPQEFDLFNDEEPADYDPQCTWDTYEENMIRYDPTDRGFGEFFVYASCHWPEHFGTVTIEPLPSLENIENLCQAGSRRLQNWIKQNCRPECTIKPRFVFESALYDPLSITSLYGSESMLQNMLERSNFDNGKFLPTPAMGAADQILQWGDLSRLRMLFVSSSVGYQLRTLEFFQLVMKQWSEPGAHCQDWDVVFDLIGDVLDIMVKERWGNELFRMAARMGCIPILRHLMDRSQHKAELRSELLRAHEPQVMAFSKPVNQSIGEAVLENHIDVVEYLLEQQGIEAHLQHRNLRGENVLHLASRRCNPSMFRLLVPRFKIGIHQTDYQKETVLVRIIKYAPASQDRIDSVKILLLEGGANVDEPFDEEQDPLRIAILLGDLGMCRLLVEIGGMNPLSALRRDSDGQMVLKDVTSQNVENMLAILQYLRGKVDT